MLPVLVIFIIIFLFSSFANLVKFLGWSQGTHTTGIVISKNENYDGSFTTYEIQIGDGAETKKCKYTVNKKETEELSLNQPIAVVVDKNVPPSLITEKQFKDIKKNIVLYPILFIVSIFLFILLVNILY